MPAVSRYLRTATTSFRAGPGGSTLADADIASSASVNAATQLQWASMTTGPKRLKPLATVTAAATVPAVGGAAANEGWRDDSYSGTNQATAAIRVHGTWSVSLQQHQTGSPVDVPVNYTVIAYAVDGANGTREAFRATLAGVATAVVSNQTVTAVVDFNLAAGEILQYEVYVEHLNGLNPTVTFTLYLGHDLTHPLDSQESGLSFDPLAAMTGKSGATGLLAGLGHPSAAVTGKSGALGSVAGLLLEKGGMSGKSGSLGHVAGLLLEKGGVQGQSGASGSLGAVLREAGGITGRSGALGHAAAIQSYVDTVTARSGASGSLAALLLEKGGMQGFDGSLGVLGGLVQASAAMSGRSGSTGHLAGSLTYVATLSGRSGSTGSLAGLTSHPATLTGRSGSQGTIAGLLALTVPAVPPSLQTCTPVPQNPVDSTYTVTVPPTAGPGGVLLFAVEAGGGPPMEPGGWTLVDTAISGGDRLSIFAHPIGNTEPATYVFDGSPGDNGAALLQWWAPTDTTNPVDTHAIEASSNVSILLEPLPGQAPDAISTRPHDVPARFYGTNALSLGILADLPLPSPGPVQQQDCATVAPGHYLAATHSPELVVAGTHAGTATYNYGIATVVAAYDTAGATVLLAPAPASFLIGRSGSSGSLAGVRTERTALSGLSGSSGRLAGLLSQQPAITGRSGALGSLAALLLRADGLHGFAGASGAAHVIQNPAGTMHGTSASSGHAGGLLRLVAGLHGHAGATGRLHPTLEENLVAVGGADTYWHADPADTQWSATRSGQRWDTGDPMSEEG